MIKKLVHLNKQDLHGLEAGSDIVKILKDKDVGKIELTLRNNFQWGVEKPQLKENNRFLRGKNAKI